MPTAVLAAKKKPAAPPQSAAPASSPAAGAQVLGTSGAWSAYLSRERSGRVCYLIGTPQHSEPANAKRKAPTAMVTHRPDEKIDNVVSFVEGYPLKEGSDVALDIGGSKYELFTKNDSAWARTSDLDKTIVEALAKGKKATVKGIPAKGSDTADVYALNGFGQALAMIDKACGVKR